MSHTLGKRKDDGRFEKISTTNSLVHSDRGLSQPWLQEVPPHLPQEVLDDVYLLSDPAWLGQGNGSFSKQSTRNSRMSFPPSLAELLLAGTPVTLAEDEPLTTLRSKLQFHGKCTGLSSTSSPHAPLKNFSKIFG